MAVSTVWHEQGYFLVSKMHETYVHSSCATNIVQWLSITPLNETVSLFLR